MRRSFRLSYFACFVALALLTACSKDDDAPVQEKASRTVLVYIVADNNGLASFASDDIAEMVEGYASVDADKDNLLVYVDGNSTPCVIQLKKNKNGTVIQDTIYRYPEQNSLDVPVMSEVFERTFAGFPADSYGLVLWSHGDGWIPATTASVSTRWFGYDEDTQMDISALKLALEAAPHFDFILSDACFMQSVEVAYELSSCVDYFISSPTEIPGPGAFYTDVVPAMFQETSTKKESAIAIASGYYNYYNAKYNDGIGLSNSNWTAGVSVSVVESDKLDDLATATKSLLPQYISDGAVIGTSGILCYDPYRNKYYYDMYGLMKSLAGEGSAYTNWKIAFTNAVIWAETTDENYCTDAFGSGSMHSMTGFSGLSIYIPRGNSASTLNKFYHSYQWYTDGGWSDTGW
ncbi:clostripain-related cysteine peptidase [uncultured Bacteroides sp.]|uniref:clostripain-related cysteine peptidase n=1 Tax=uncultured Bacteroides sp. TaxID=162156 RepID=UPI002AA671D1|nr:clostripain-related cysteine peptidase [uncultured Bacteroides sp.]